MSSVSDRVIGGRYRLAEALGRGGMGAVWRARDEVLARDVAIKELVFPPGLTRQDQEVMRGRTMREARTAARLSHPGVVRIYDVVEEEQRPWIVMELLPEARSLSEILAQDGSLTPRHAAKIGLEVLAGLAAAHAAGVLHRDVKPGNILITTDGRAVLGDFGIAVAEEEPTLTRSGVLIGSPAYLSPEQARGVDLTPASDLWSLGATLYTIVEGETPFHRDNVMATLTAILTDPPIPPRRSGPLTPVIEGLLRKEPEARLDTATVAAMLTDIAAEPSADAAPPATTTDPDPAERPAVIHKMPVGHEDTDRPVPEAEPPSAEEPTAEPGARQDTTLPPGAAEQPHATEPPHIGESPGTAQSRSGARPRIRIGGRPEAMGTGTTSGEHGAPTRAAGSAGPAGTGPARRRRIVAAALLLAGGVMLTVTLLRDPPTHRATSTGAGSNRPRTSRISHGPATTPGGRATTPGGTASSSGAAPSGGPRGTVVPAGFHRYKDPSGFAIDVPNGWQISHSGGYVYVREPGGARYLLIDQTTHPKSDPLADWRDQDAYRRQNDSGYHRVRLESVHGYFEKAADLEFTHSGGGGRTHVLNRNILVNDHRAYALYWSTPEDEWSRSKRYFDVFASGFAPAS